MAVISINTSVLSALCRLCLRSDVTLLNIFHFPTNEVADVIMTCVPIQITKRDVIPNFICELCYNKLVKVHQFQLQIMQSDKTWQRYLQQLNFPTKQTKFQVSVPSPSEDSLRHNIDANLSFKSESFEEMSPMKLDSESEINNNEESLSFKVNDETIDDVVYSCVGAGCVGNCECADTTTELIDMDIDEEETVSPSEIIKSEIQNESMDNNSFVPTESVNDSANPSAQISCKDTLRSLENLRSEQNKFNFSACQVECKKLIDEDYRCIVCKKYFASSLALKKHNLLHSREKPYQCDVCEKCFGQRWHLKDHMRIHTGERPFRCDFCEKCFGKRSHLNDHIKIHTGEKPFRCDVCEKCFGRRSYLKDHMRVHSGEKPFRCDVCEKCFGQRSQLNDHNKIHTGEKPNRCEVCKKCFIKASDLKRHNYVHTGEKPYRCEVCKKSFIKASDLKRHNYVHTGEKLHQCDVCKKCFSSTSNLKRYNRVHIITGK